MKKILSFLALIVTLALLPVSTANANHNGRLVGRTPCGIPIYATHEIVGHDHCGRNVWQWVTHYPNSCHCRDHSREDDHCSSSRRYYDAPRRGTSWNFSIEF